MFFFKVDFGLHFCTTSWFNATTISTAHLKTFSCTHVALLEEPVTSAFHWHIYTVANVQMTIKPWNLRNLHTAHKDNSHSQLKSGDCTLNKGRKSGESWETISKATKRKRLDERKQKNHAYSLCVCRWVTSAACAAGVSAVRCWQTRTSWDSSRPSMSWPPERDTSTAGWAALRSSSSLRCGVKVRRNLYWLHLWW